MSDSNEITESALKQAHERSCRNKATLSASEKAGCFHCCKVYPASQVKEWIREEGDGATAVCPHCGIDSVIGSSSGWPLTAAFLEAMRHRWFGE